MTLANTRENGVRSLLVYSSAPPRIVMFNVDAYPEAVPVQAFGPRMVCTGGGMVGATSGKSAPPKCQCLEALGRVLTLILSGSDAKRTSPLWTNAFSNLTGAQRERIPCTRQL